MASDWGGVALGFELYELENPYQEFYDVQSMPSGLPSPPTEFSIARGEQKTIAYWMHNDGTSTVDVDIYLRDIVEAHDTFPGWAIDARVLTYRNRVVFTGYEAGDPQWADADSDGTLSMGDIEAIWDDATTYGTNPGDPNPNNVTRKATSDTNNSALINAYKDPDPLPLYGTYGTDIQQDITLGPSESAVLWLVITVPDDMATGTYYEPPTTPGGTGPVNFIVDDGTQSDVYDLDLEIHVPCWDPLNVEEMSLWDYSYRPGTTAPEHSGVLSTGNLADERARLRTLGGHNAVAVYLGYPSRTPGASDPIQDPFRWILAGLDYELRRYEDDPSNPDHIDTIVLLMALDAVTLGGDWGTTSPAVPDAAWTARYRQTLIDFEEQMEAPWPGRNIDLSQYNLVIVPVDEPTSYVAGGTCTHGAGLADNICTNPLSGGRECWGQNTLDMDPGAGTFDVTRKDLFRASARAIESLPDTVAAERWTLVNHDVRQNTRCQELLDEFEDCGGGNTDCVHIWMSAGLMDDDVAGLHPFNDGDPSGGLPWADLSGDKFWWYKFDGRDSADTAALRHAQSGLEMDRLNYSGHANWAFWAASPTLDVSTDPTAPREEQWVADPSTVYNRHSWVSTYPRLWEQDNTVYLSPTTTDANYFPSPDATAPADTPIAEAFIPGRVLLGQRQALEYQRLRRLLDTMPDGAGGTLALTGAASSTLELLRIGAVNACHSDGDCVSDRVTPEEWSLVVHEWLNDAAFEADGCVSPSVPYGGTNSDVLSALSMNPWEAP